MKLRLKQKDGIIQRGAVLVLCALFVGSVIVRIQDTATAVAADEQRTGEDTKKRCSVRVTSTKDLSNVVIGFCDGTTEKIDGLTGTKATIRPSRSNKKKEICCVWIKSGCNDSGDGPGYGEKIVNPGTDEIVHGQNDDEGCIPHVTACFRCR